MSLKQILMEFCSNLFIGIEVWIFFSLLKIKQLQKFFLFLIVKLNGKHMPALIFQKSDRLFVFKLIYMYAQKNKKTIKKR